MKTNFISRSYLKSLNRCFYLVIVLGMAVNASLSAQCSLACKSAINVSVAEGGDCSIMLSADIILNGSTTSCPMGADYEGTITYADGTSYTEMLPFTWDNAYDFIHESVSLSIKDPLSNNTCWGTLNIEDKLAPIIDCPDGGLEVIDVVSCCSDLILVNPGTSPGIGMGACLDVDLALMPTTGSGSPCVQECSDYTWVVLTQTTTPNDCLGSICDEYSKVIERTLVAVDEWGLVSEDTLKQTINVRRLGISTANIVCPVGTTTPVNITCETLPEETIFIDEIEVPAATLNGGGLPSIIKDGVTIPLFPLNAGDSLTTTVFQECNVYARFEDRLIPKVGGCGGYTLVRNWIITESTCGDDTVIPCTQVFELVDEDGPTLVSGVNDFEGTTNGYTCEGNVFVPAPVFVDVCSGIQSIDVTFPGGFIEGFSPNGGFIELPVGSNEVIFVAYDECHNITATPDTVIVDVWDKTPPVAICDEHTVVSLADFGKDENGVNSFSAEVPAEVFDDGSYDDCGISNVLVSKMNLDLCGLGQDTIFAPTVKFCCDEDFVMVILRVYDQNDNFNDCMFEVEIQNKIEPKILNCPADIMVSCDLNINASEPNLSNIFGTLVSEAELVETYDFRGGDQTGGFLVEGIGTELDTLCDGSDAEPFELWDGQYWDNCGGATVQTTVADGRNKCGIGTITRVFRLFGTDNKQADLCRQRIRVKAIKEFDFKTIVMPLDTSIMSCGFPEDYGPEVTGYPEIVEGQCDLVGFNYTDQVFLFNEYDINSTQACFKILRTWQFIDWCSFEGDDNQPYPMPPYEQVIKVTDQDAPEILFTCEERAECSFDAECNSGYIELLKTAIDGCTGSDHLRWEASVFIDIKAETNVVDTVFTGVGNLANASAHYPIGKHLVTWSFWDRCGNVTHCDQIFTIKNCKAAAPYCIDGLVVDLMPVDENGDGEPDSGMVELWASDFDLGSSHPCGYDVILSFSDDISETNRTFTCSEANQTVNIEIYTSVIVGEGEHEEIVQSFCRTTLKVQDNMNACSSVAGEGRALISGLITTELDQNVAETVVNLEGTELAPAMTNELGKYAFPGMTMGGAYVVAPAKDKDDINGVSTLDLVMIQKHILGLTLLEGPYKKIAADINKDQNISASDLVELRKLILGNIDSYSYNDSWRFVDKDYTFANSNNPLSELFSEDYEISSLDTDMDIDFTAVKIGDVNNSVTIANYLTTEVRSSNKLELTGVSEVNGEQIRIPVTSKSKELLSGLQFTLDYTLLNLDFVNIESGKLNINQDNLGLRSSDRGLVALSWNAAELVSVDKDEVLFTIVLSGSNKDLNQIELNSEITTAEAYTTGNEIMDVNLELEGSSIAAHTYELKQNTPNPFKDGTTISFTLPQSMNATISIHDITGKLVRQYQNSFSAGLNSIELSRSDLNTSGILYYTLKTDNYSATKRMVILD